MKTKVSLVALATALSIGSAFAADLPSTKGPAFVPPPPPLLWTGFYVGVNGGYGGGGNDFTSSDFSPSGGVGVGTSNGTARTGGALVGGQIGYNYELSNQLVLGGEVDIDWADRASSSNSNSNTAISGGEFPSQLNIGGDFHNVGLDWLGTARLRVGYDLGCFLPYITGGVAFGGLSSNNSTWATSASTDGGSISTGSASGSTTSVGWAAGAGLEFLISNTWSVKAEYLYTQLGSVTQTGATISAPVGFAGPGGVAFQTQTNRDFGTHSVRVGLNYHFNTVATAPVLAAAPILAADLPSTKGPVLVPPPPALLWTGFYVGVNGGYGGGNNDVTVTALGVSGPQVFSGTQIGVDRTGGALVGGQIGYNYELSSRLVLGGEVDIDWADPATNTNSNSNNASSGAGFSSVGIGGDVNNVGLDWLGTARLRLGYDLGRLLPYITGGVAFGGLSSNSRSWAASASGLSGAVAAGSASGSTTSAGWAAGAGVEYLISNNWSVKAEYLYTQLGSVTQTGASIEAIVGPFAGPPSLLFSTQTNRDFGTHSVRAGLNYHFSTAAAAPIFANY
ncbi:outer membrane protein [Methylocystis bryophila]|uniref:Outer membrane protein beta-barrel domain-containing protein n=1 Tax=Methylocystis bryophila TaxID=655015 RepID=A0A1W6MRC5_9HYPH|nr:outer membrane beta-barrel protein [Methylocystis bryophila]ARN80154.1 hypothetical protein B1812_02600 [Methylocystis bryophila]BDV40095.1 hypothetical protein DSM21852_33480 [Methylocystis bryophila]